MQRLTGYNMVVAINQLNRHINYNYINPNSGSLIKIIDIALPEGPITIRRWTPSRGQTFENATNETISTEMIWRVSNAFIEGQPINIDRVLAGSYNTRSVLESLIAHTPQFYYCYPGRIFDVPGQSRVEVGHKHLLWLPSDPHPLGLLVRKNIDVAISEIPFSAAMYDSLLLPNNFDLQGMNIDIARRHTQIQIALFLIGKQLGYRTWIAQNDRGISYQDQPLLQHEGIVQSLQNEMLVAPFEGAVNAGLFIDNIWFKNGRLMPAVMEVEHTTGIASGLSRMLNFYNKIGRGSCRERV